MDSIDFPGVVFRILSAKDLPQFLRIRNSVSKFLHDGRNFDLQECQTWFLTNTNTYYLVDSINGDTLGYFRTARNSKASSSIEIGLDLDPKYHGRKWAKHIYRHFIMDVLQDLDVDTITLRVLKDNVRAINLYHSMGLSKISETSLDFELRITMADLLDNLNHWSTSLEHVSEDE